MTPGGRPERPTAVEHTPVVEGHELAGPQREFDRVVVGVEEVDEGAVRVVERRGSWIAGRQRLHRSIVDAHRMDPAPPVELDQWPLGAEIDVVGVEPEGHVGGGEDAERRRVGLAQLLGHGVAVDEATRSTLVGGDEAMQHLPHW